MTDARFDPYAPRAGDMTFDPKTAGVLLPGVFVVASDAPLISALWLLVVAVDITRHVMQRRRAASTSWELNT